MANYRFNTMADVRMYNEREGFFFFAPKTMKFFNTKIQTTLIRNKYFITSETFVSSDGSRNTDYSIREEKPNASINTIASFNSLAKAKNYLETLK